MEDRMRAERDAAESERKPLHLPTPTHALIPSDRRERQSGSPTHLSRPTYTHQRRDSDTLRSAQPAEQRVSPREAARYHRRNPTAPEAPTTSGLINPPGLGGEQQGKTWAAGDERSPTATAGAYQHTAHAQTQRPRESHRQAPTPMAPPAAARSAKPTILVSAGVGLM